MESMSPQLENIGQSRSASLTGETKICVESKKKMKTLTQRRQSAPSLVLRITAFHRLARRRAPWSSPS
ncbi:hypothetical protein JZ751_018414 [Albula glossodonta]|uniref:Uncharacterized protein n=1 Tax=Albula glossodonta TaxID=121402 RepID=A0A8T2MIS4_9TELE|nr:hypothetical protein JZ751_018414 [Albula glossodonta]